MHLRPNGLASFATARDGRAGIIQGCRESAVGTSSMDWQPSFSLSAAINLDACDTTQI